LVLSPVSHHTPTQNPTPTPTPTPIHIFANIKKITLYIYLINKKQI